MLYYVPVQNASFIRPRPGVVSRGELIVNWPANPPVYQSTNPYMRQGAGSNVTNQGDTTLLLEAVDAL